MFSSSFFLRLFQGSENTSDIYFILFIYFFQEKQAA